MSRTRSGLALIAIGVGLNLLGRAVPSGNSLTLSAVVAVDEFASIVLVLFGLFRFVSGLLTRRGVPSSSSGDSAADAGVWPPPPKPLEAE